MNLSALAASVCPGAPQPQTQASPIAVCPKCGAKSGVPNYFDELTNFRTDDAELKEEADQLLIWILSFNEEFEKLKRKQKAVARPDREQEFEAAKARFRKLDAEIADKENEKSDHRLAAQRRNNAIQVIDAELFGAKQRRAHLRAACASSADINKAEAKVRTLQEKRDALRNSPDPMMYYNYLENPVIPELMKKRTDAKNRADALARDLGIDVAPEQTNEYGFR